jgi:plastocyanin
MSRSGSRDPAPGSHTSAFGECALYFRLWPGWAVVGTRLSGWGALSGQLARCGTEQMAGVELPSRTLIWWSVRTMVGDSFIANESFTATFRFAQKTISVHSGDTVRWQNLTTDPDTMSVAAAADVPKSVDQLLNYAGCGPFLEVTRSSQPPPGRRSRTSVRSIRGCRPLSKSSVSATPAD